MTIDFSSVEEQHLVQSARQEGLEPAAYVKKLIREHLPLPVNSVAHIQELLDQWRADDNTPAVTPMPGGRGEHPTQTLFRRWDEEDAAMTPEEREAEDKLWQEFENGLNETRTAQSMRRLT